ncbi:hypothetical protein Tco_0031698 [Tanacetum coccineum]
MSTNEQTPPSQPTSAMRNTLGKEQVPQDLKPRDTLSQERRAEEGTLRKGLDLGMFVACPKALSQGTVVPDHQGRRIQKGDQCSKDWKKVYFTGQETRRRICPHIQEIQGIGHTIAVAGTQKSITKVLAVEKQKLLLRNIVTKESPHKGRRHYRKVKEAQEGIGSQNQRSKS